MIFVITVVRSFFSAERARRLLSGKRVGSGNVLAATLGIVTPFCSCSAVPLFIGFVESGIPLGVTFSFLIAAPVINEVALVLLFGMFGWRVAGLYVASGLTIAIVTGLILGRLRLERHAEEDTSYLTECENSSILELWKPWRSWEPSGRWRRIRDSPCSGCS